VQLRVVVAGPFAPEDVALIAEREPRLELVHETSLLPDPRSDWMARHERSPEEQARFEALVDTAEALLGVPDGSGRALARAVAANPRLRWVHTIPAGGGQQVRAAGLSAVELERVVFTTSAGVHAGPLSEFALLGVLAGLKQLPQLQADQRAHHWPPRRRPGALSDATVAVVGLGAIGRMTALRLAQLGARVIGVHRRPVDAAGVAEIRPVEELPAVLAEADAVVLALPGTELTRGMLGRTALDAARPGLIVVNVGRGTTLDEEALIEALQDGRVGFAALDVFAREPLDPASPLWDLPNVLISPHSATWSPHEPRRIAELFAENARRLLDGELMLNVVNTVEFY